MATKSNAAPSSGAVGSAATPAPSANVAPFPASQPWHTIAHPQTNSKVWAQFPGVDTGTRIFEPGPIYLKYGEHWGAHSGYGFIHIWNERYKKMAAVPYLALPHVVTFFNQIMRPGSSIHYEFRNGRKDSARTTTMRGNLGVVVLEERQDKENNTSYSIVTMIPHVKAKGPKVGSL